MNSLLRLALPAIILLPIIVSCGSNRVHDEGNGNITTSDMAVNSFRKLVIKSNYEIYLIDGNEELVKVETDENLMQYVKTEVSRNTLTIENSERVKSNHGIKLYVNYNTLEAIEIADGARIYTEQPITVDQLELDFAGGSIGNLELQVQKLNVKFGGGGLMTLRGSASESQINFNGAGMLDAGELNTQNTVIDMSGMGAAIVSASDNLEADLSGVGSITFKGDPRNLNRNISGKGTINRAE